MRELFSMWHFDGVLLFFMAMLAVLYLYLVNFKPDKRSIYFLLGLMVMFICIVSPLHYLGMHYLFSLHMITHVLLLLIATPLMVLGIPAHHKLLESFSKKISGHPFIGWFMGVGIMWLWHIPAIYHRLFAMHEDGSMVNVWQYMHVLSLWLAGILFCWPLIGPYKQHRILPLTGVLYLATACIACSLLGLLITFAPPGLYHIQMVMQHTMHSKYDVWDNIIQNRWGITPEMDQQIAGLIMWVPCCFIYLSGAMFLLKKWLYDKDERVVVQMEA
jgi:cytochrome c oxidase assembly factor CtaG